MNILFIITVYPPEGEPSAIMAKQIAEHLISQGHSVTVVCPFPNRPKGKVFSGYTRKWASVTEENGVRVVRVLTWLIGEERTSFNRIMENISFGITSSLQIISKRPELILLESWPILACLPVMALAKLYNIPVVSYVKDIYPESAVAHGIIRSKSFIAKMLTCIDVAICRWSWLNIVISNTMHDHLMRYRRLPSSKLRIIWDWLDLSSIYPVQVDGTWRREVGIDTDDFVCMFSGTMGFASGADILIDVAGLLAKFPKLKIVCIGEGTLKNRMVSEAAKRNLNNLLFLPFQPRERLCEVQSSSDVMLLTTTATMGTTSVPSKFITYIAIGKPVICAAGQDSDLTQIVTTQKLGISVPPGSAEEIANAICKMMELAIEERVAMGKRARSVALSKHSIETAMNAFTNLIEEAKNTFQLTKV
jgi:colanic acid biosynthesis glycosyl transferase WcaI